MNNSIIKIGLAIVLFLCLFNMPYGFYQFVRFISMCGFVYLAYSSNEVNKKNEAFIYIGLAILFQPFIKIALGRTIWNVVDLVVGISLILSLFQSKTKDK